MLYEPRDDTQGEEGGSHPPAGIGGRGPIQPALSSDGAPRLFLVSDIHVDAAENWQWLEQLSGTSYQRDGLIVAGDVSEEIQRVEAALRLLTSKFARVFFCPGNHDLWVQAHEPHHDSMTKLRALLALCDRLGVITRPTRFGDAPPHHGVWVCPVLSFHHKSFDTEPDVAGWAIPSAEESMVDYRACVWPKPLSMLDDSVASHVDGLNEAHWATAPEGDATVALAQRPASEPLIT